jgi:hypothetical protein
MQEKNPSHESETAPERSYRGEQGELLLLWHIDWEEGVSAETREGAVSSERHGKKNFELE